jgi:hypothetical protein
MVSPNAVRSIDGLIELMRMDNEYGDCIFGLSKGPESGSTDIAAEVNVT